ncbi:hypothetical protein BV898_10555 [Hypsibius exemplaris]|uniref:Uncharacterized protein n=1 Tax=Hypsibius exemplaris TaxID=2072580 RepID=A0A1W0WJH5_HYPEX|nr:hypothetical protein BV898_10555 [Hypsibius exemplaris]
MAVNVPIKLAFQAIRALSVWHAPRSLSYVAATIRRPFFLHNPILPSAPFFSSSAVMLNDTERAKKRRRQQFRKKEVISVEKPLDLNPSDPAPSSANSPSADPNTGGRCIINLLDPAHAVRLQELQAIFPKKDIKTLAIRSPQVFFQEFEDIMQIVQYIYTRMGLNQGEMVKAGVFDYPLEHIVRRHVFAERCGVYQMVPEKKPEMVQLNPQLEALIRTSNKNYVRMIGMTLEEYEVFCEVWDQFERHKMEDLKIDLMRVRKRGGRNLVKGSDEEKNDHEDEEDEEEEDEEDNEDNEKDEQFYL